MRMIPFRQVYSLCLMKRSRTMMTRPEVALFHLPDLPVDLERKHWSSSRRSNICCGNCNKKQRKMKPMKHEEANEALVRCMPKGSSAQEMQVAKPAWLRRCETKILKRKVSLVTWTAVYLMYRTDKKKGLFAPAVPLHPCMKRNVLARSIFHFLFIQGKYGWKLIFKTHLNCTSPQLVQKGGVTFRTSFQ